MKALEIFGLPAAVVAQRGAEYVAQYSCPFTSRRCDKRAGGLSHPFGVCSAEYKPTFLNRAKPHILCPHRLGTAQVLRQGIRVMGLPEDAVLLKNVKLGTLGALDYVAVAYNRQSRAITDFLGIEVMAMSTTSTGGLVQNLRDVLAGEPKPSYKYGMNYKQVVSRMLPQICGKGNAFARWGKRMVWIVQDILHAYMKHVYDVHLVDGVELGQPIGLITFKMTQGPTDQALALVLDASYSGEARHFADILYTAQIPTKQEAEDAIRRRLENE